MVARCRKCHRFIKYSNHTNYCMPDCKGIPNTGKSWIKKGERRSINTEIKLGQRLSPRTEFKKGQHFSPETELKSEDVRGKNNVRWSGGVTTELMKRVTSNEWRIIRAKVLKRDKHTCLNCGAKDVILSVNHKTPFRLTKDNSLENLETLCRPCHLKADYKWIRAGTYEN